MPRGGQNLNDLTGQKIGRLRILSRAGSDKHGNAMWEARCSGKYHKDGKSIHVVVRGADLLNGRIKSCGCYSRDTAKSRSTGASVDGVQTPEYMIFHNMLARCYNENHISYKNYGGRGIKVCRRWRRKGYLAFIKDLGLRKDKTYSLNRIDNDGHYSCGKCKQCKRKGWPANCEWASLETQANNKRNSVKIPFKGKDKTVAEVARILDILPQVIYNRLKSGYSKTAVLEGLLPSKKSCKDKVKT